MRIHRLIPFALLSTLAACGSEAAQASADSIAGHWAQVTGTDAKGMTIEFDAESDGMMVHTAPRPDGTHDHMSGTFTFESTTHAVTVNCALMGEGKGDHWKGSVNGENLTIESGETKLTFHKGADPHAQEHK